MSDYKVAIVGAGVSGLYAAWRLCVDTPTLKPSDIVLLEASERTGGRLRTWTLDRIDPTLPADPAVRAELGGMRVLNYNLYVCSLVQKFALPMVSFPADVATNWHYLRGQTIQGGNYPEQKIYPLPQDTEAGWTPGDVVYEPLTGRTGTIPVDWYPSETVTQRDFVNKVLTADVGGAPAWQQGFWNAILGSGQDNGRGEVSYQAYAYFTEAGAYDTIPSNWNAGVAISNLLGDFANQPEYYALTYGYERLPDAIAAELAAAGLTPRLKAPVSRIFRLSATSNFELLIADGGSLTADQVVLAMPPRAVEAIAYNASAQDALGEEPLAGLVPQLRQSAPIPLFKLFLVFDQDWWSGAIPPDQWPQFTRMTTDMPMRQIYYFGSTKSDGGKAYHLFQAVYCDALKAGYWAGLMPQQADREDGEDVNTDIFARIENLQGSNIETGTMRFCTHDKLEDFPLFQSAYDQFVTLVAAIAGGGVTPVPPVAGAAMNWGTDPFGGGVNFWNVGVELDDGKGGGAYWDLINPTPGVYIIGEGYSLYQGWVEGAIWSAEDMLEKHFGLTVPGWLNTKPYSLPEGRPSVLAAARGLTAKAAR